MKCLCCLRAEGGVAGQERKRENNGIELTLICIAGGLGGQEGGHLPLFHVFLHHGAAVTPTKDTDIEQDTTLTFHQHLFLPHSLFSHPGEEEQSAVREGRGISASERGMLQAPGARLLRPRGARPSRTAFKMHSLTAHARRRSHAAINDLLLPPAVLSLDRETKKRKKEKTERKATI